MNDSSPGSIPPSYNAMDRARAVSQALADAARRARFSSRSRGAHQRTSFEARRGARAIRILTLVLFFVMVAAPNVICLVYYTLIASDQFVSEAKFTVSSGAIPKMDGLGSVTGVPAMLIFQDTQAIANYIESRTLVEELERRVDLREIYGSDSVDWWARFNKTKPIEKFTDYWNKMSKVTITLPAAIVTLSVRAFSPAEARRVAEVVLDRCEALVNGLNDRMRRDFQQASEEDLKRSAQRLTQARVNMEQARNAGGLLDVKEASTSFGKLLSGLETDLIKAQQNYQTQLRYVSEDAPQMRVLKSRIGAMNVQVDELRKKITSQEEQGISALAEKTLSGKMTTFASLDLEQRIAEKRYASAAAALEAARILSERKMLYLHRIVAPATPEEALYPKRGLTLGVILLVTVAAWLLVIGLVSLARNHMA